MAEANVTPQDLDGVAFTAGPGLVGRSWLALRLGAV